MKSRRSACCLLWLCVTLFCQAAIAATASPTAPVQQLRITVLSTMLAGEMDRGLGEWGFSALVEVDGKRLLFDTGQRPTTVENNARELGIDLSGIRDVVLSHNHPDHVGGLLTLRAALAGKDAASLSRAHVGAGAFTSRGPGEFEGDDNPLIAIRTAYQKSGGVFIEHDRPVELLPGVWFTGPIPRKYPNEQPVPPGWELRAPNGKMIPDTTPEDSALVFDTARGLVVLTGCGHAGLINTLDYARQITGHPSAPIYAIAGGFHLARASDEALDWTVEKLRGLGVQYVHGAHCTGIEPVYRIRAKLNLPREAASVAAVGSWFDLEKGIFPLSLAH